MMNIFAYLDPGTGSLLIQALIAGMLGMGYAFRAFIANFFSRFKRKKDDSDEVER